MSMSMPIFRRRIRRLFKFSSMDFDLAIWEMTSLLTSPKAVFKGFYYHKQTKNTYHRPDPSFTYLLVSLLFITSLAWGFAYLPSVSFTSLLKLSLSFVFIQFLGVALLISTTMYFLARKVFCMGGFLSRWRGAERIVKRFGLGLIGGRRRGLFVDTTATSNEVEFGYCFDVCSPKSPEYMKNFAIDPLLMVSNRAFFPVFVLLYVVQFILLPLLTHKPTILSVLLSNTLYFVAFSYYVYITFLGYQLLPCLHNTEIMLLPIPIFAVMWLVALICGWSIVGQGGAVKTLFWPWIGLGQH